MARVGVGVGVAGTETTWTVAVVEGAEDTFTTIGVVREGHVGIAVDSTS